MKLEIDNIEQLASALETFSRAVVVFTQPATCVPCRALKPHLDKFAGKHERPVILVVDLDKVPQAMVDYSLMAVPTLQLYENVYRRDVKARTLLQLEHELLD